MAELTNKLHYKKDGITDEIKLYTTTAECNENYVQLKSNGITCYAGWGGDGTDSRMSYKKNGVTNLLKKEPQQSVNAGSFTKEGQATIDFSFTIPSGVHVVKVYIHSTGFASKETSIRNRANLIYWGYRSTSSTGSLTFYVEVTPNKTYSLRYLGESSISSEATLSWSDDINLVTPTVTDI